ncbi:DUF4831 family protein [Costertonia aggregata]|uniref:DUF4831 family protein n=1 Tax=Costertonia aggregata TaxID=343403 RepID=A0A7H9APP4_9FLAO|nr:DUF4831 family protein [Costertonia aggregata]QLG45402.1 DUF4831 family protein [Costertonia aggregata]
MKLFIVFFVIGNFLCFGQRIQIQNVSSQNKVDNFGIFYCLPKTTIQLEFEIIKESFLPPENLSLCNKLFGDCQTYFGNKNVPYKKSSKIIIQDLKVKTDAIVDSEHIYRVNPSKKWNKNKSVSFTLNENGLIKGASISNIDKSFDIITSAISSFAGLGKSNLFNNDIAVNQQLTESEIILRNRIKRLIGSKYQLITSENFSGDKETLQFKLNEIDKILLKILEGVIGTKQVETQKLRFTILNPDIERDYTLFTVYNSENNTGINIQTDFKDQNFLKPNFRNSNSLGSNKKFEISIKPNGKSMGEILKSKMNSTNNLNGMVYRIPGSVNLKAYYGKVSLKPGENEKIEVFKENYLISQVGAVAYLPYRMDSASLELYEELGWLKSVSVSSSAITSEQVGNLAQTIKDAKKAIDGETEVEELTKKIELLKLRKEYSELLNSKE